jgi:hypothetical protein
MKHKYANQSPMVSGETVVAGVYRCLQCEYEHEIREGVVNLPICPRCHNDAWELAE